VPLYEYRCRQCGHQFEKIQSFSAPDEKECPVCKGELERLISAPAIQFKGSGWYVNDYAPKGGSNAGGSAGESSGDGNSKPATTESKPAASAPESSGASKPSTSAKSE
jgi:putative FmdB family regulatory protein